jgi:hypothetical protein
MQLVAGLQMLPLTSTRVPLTPRCLPSHLHLDQQLPSGQQPPFQMAALLLARIIEHPENGLAQYVE